MFIVIVIQEMEEERHLAEMREDPLERNVRTVQVTESREIYPNEPPESSENHIYDTAKQYGCQGLYANYAN